eukprot:752239-Hanusia_phi.AAC.1
MIGGIGHSSLTFVFFTSRVSSTVHGCPAVRSDQSVTVRARRAQPGLPPGSGHIDHPDSGPPGKSGAGKDKEVSFAPPGYRLARHTVTGPDRIDLLEEDSLRRGDRYTGTPDSTAGPFYIFQQLFSISLNRSLVLPELGAMTPRINRRGYSRLRASRGQPAATGAAIVDDSRVSLI